MTNTYGRTFKFSAGARKENHLLKRESANKRVQKGIAHKKDRRRQRKDVFGFIDIYEYLEGDNAKDTDTRPER